MNTHDVFDKLHEALIHAIGFTCVCCAYVVFFNHYFLFSLKHNT